MSLSLSLSLYIYIYIYVHTCIAPGHLRGAASGRQPSAGNADPISYMSGHPGETNTNDS